MVEIHVGPDGGAAWTVEYRVRLADEETTEAFEAVEEDAAANPEGYVSSFAEQVNASVAAASDRVGREMSAHDYAVSTSVQSIPAEYGIVRYTFDWESFAMTDDERLVVGDAVAGFVLDANTRLVVAWPSALTLERAVPDPDERRDRAVVWNGRETDFVASEPVVELRRTDGAERARRTVERAGDRLDDARERIDRVGRQVDGDDSEAARTLRRAEAALGEAGRLHDVARTALSDGEFERAAGRAGESIASAAEAVGYAARASELAGGGDRRPREPGPEGE